MYTQLEIGRKKMAAINLYRKASSLLREGKKEEAETVLNEYRNLNKEVLEMERG